MYNITAANRPPIGSILARPKFLFTHRGIYLGNLFGFDQVFENSPPHGVRLVPYAEFAQGQPVTIERQSGFPPHKLIARVQQALRDGKPYDLFTNNCDHTVTRLVDGTAFSLQVLVWSVAVVIAGVMALSSRKA